MTTSLSIKMPAVIVICLLIPLLGCQTNQPMKPGVMDNASFMDLWKTYIHCQAGSDIEGLKSDVVVLAGAANDAQTQESFVLPLPQKLEQYVSQPTTRIAVDVNPLATPGCIGCGTPALERAYVT